METRAQMTEPRLVRRSMKIRRNPFSAIGMGTPIGMTASLPLGFSLGSSSGDTSIPGIAAPVRTAFNACCMSATIPPH